MSYGKKNKIKNIIVFIGIFILVTIILLCIITFLKTKSIVVSIEDDGKVTKIDIDNSGIVKLPAAEEKKWLYIFILFN